MTKALVVLLLCTISSVNGFNVEQRLLAKLFDEDHYDKRVRPVRDPLHAVKISFSYSIKYLCGVNERTQTICILTNVYQSWNDFRLDWSPLEYRNLTSFVLNFDSIWTPDTTLYNSAEMYRPSVEDLQRATVTTDVETNVSTINYFYPGRHSIICIFDMRYFPFDTQNCTFIFGSWNHDESMIDYELNNNSVSNNFYHESDAWSIISFHLDSQSVKYDVAHYNFKTMRAHLVIKRKSLYYVYNFVFPPILIKLLSSFAVLSSEGTPENRHDKLQIGITSFLSYCILLLSLSDQIPKGSTTVSLLCNFYFFIMLQSVMELLAAIYLSFPNRRQWFISVFCAKKRRRLRQKSTSPSKLDNHEEQAGAAIETRHSKCDKFNPELFFMLVSIFSTSLVTSAVFAIGYTA